MEPTPIVPGEAEFGCILQVPIWGRSERARRTSAVGLRYRALSAARRAVRSRPAEWCNWPRVSLRGGGCRLHYGVMVARLAVYLVCQPVQHLLERVLVPGPDFS